MTLMHFRPDDVAVMVAVEEFELAFARLAWARAAPCLLLKSQQSAIAWHESCCDVALALLDEQLDRKTDC